MKPALLAIVLLLAAGCGEPDKTKTLFYRQSVEGLSVDERMHIVRTLESNGWTNVEFCWDFGEIVIARKIVDKKPKGGEE